MFYLITAVLCSVSVSILLKVLRQRHIDIRQTIVAGYPVAFLLTWMLLQPDIIQVKTLNAATWGIILALGILLPYVFYWTGNLLCVLDFQSSILTLSMVLLFLWLIAMGQRKTREGMAFQVL